MSASANIPLQQYTADLPPLGGQGAGGVGQGYRALRLLRAQAWLLMFDSVDTANDCIRIATGVLSTIAINPERMLAGLSADMLATDLAEYLVRKGAPTDV